MKYVLQAFLTPCVIYAVVVASGLIWLFATRNARIINWENRQFCELKNGIRRLLKRSATIRAWAAPPVKGRPRAVIGDYLCWEHIPDDPNWTPVYRQKDFETDEK